MKKAEKKAEGEQKEKQRRNSLIAPLERYSYMRNVYEYKSI